MRFTRTEIFLKQLFYLRLEDSKTFFNKWHHVSDKNQKTKTRRNARLSILIFLLLFVLFLFLTSLTDLAGFKFRIRLNSHTFTNSFIYFSLPRHSFRKRQRLLFLLYLQPILCYHVIGFAHNHWLLLFCCRRLTKFYEKEEMFAPVCASRKSSTIREKVCTQIGFMPCQLSDALQLIRYGVE